MAGTGTRVTCPVGCLSRACGSPDGAGAGNKASLTGGATAAPRVILAALGVDVRELEDAGDANWCCGGGGGVALIKRAQPLRDAAFAIKKKQIEASGAAIVYTSCSGCRKTLDHGGKAAGWNTSVGSLLELVADNLAARAAA